MRISSYCERETAVDLGDRSFEVWAFEGAARQHRFLRVVEGDSTKLLPVTDEMILNNDLVNS